MQATLPSSLHEPTTVEMVHSSCLTDPFNVSILTSLLYFVLSGYVIFSPVIQIGYFFFYFSFSNNYKSVSSILISPLFLQIGCCNQFDFPTLNRFVPSLVLILYIELSVETMSNSGF